MTDAVRPAAIERYLERALGRAQSIPRATLLEQRGEIRLAPDKPWMPFTAEQRIEATTTGFVWHARCKMAPLVTAVVEDAYENGTGRLDAKVFGLVTVAHARGVEVDQGEAQRYLAELPWCPTALVHNPELRYRELGADRVRVSVHDDATCVDLLFDASGDLVGARADARPRGEISQGWAGRFEAYRDYGPIRAPSRGEVWWETPDGPFVYWRGAIVRLESETP